MDNLGPNRSVRLKIRPSKQAHGLYDAFFFDPRYGKKRDDLTIKGFKKDKIEHISAYHKKYPDRKKTFEKYLSEIQIQEYDHFISYLIKDAHKVEQDFKPSLPSYENKIKANRSKLITLTANKELSGSHSDFLLTSITDDVYGTTTMEGEIVNKKFVQDIIQNKHLQTNTLSEQEAKNILEGFKYAHKLSKNPSVRFNKELLIGIHKVATHGLDDFTFRGLKYNSAKFRDEGVDMGIFQKINGRSDYLPPVQPQKYFDELVKYINSGPMNLIKLSHLHLLLYSIHPFYNGNKRSTRIIESLFIQQTLDNDHYLKGMGYWFKRDIRRYFKNVREVLTGKKSLSDWTRYYMTSFVEMSEYSLKEMQHLQNNLSKRLPESRHKYYDEIDSVCYRFYVHNKDNLFTSRELLKYLEGKGIKYNEDKTILKRISKHLKDSLLLDSGEKRGKNKLFQFKVF